MVFWTVWVVCDLNVFKNSQSFTLKHADAHKYLMLLGPAERNNHDLITLQRVFIWSAFFKRQVTACFSYFYYQNDIARLTWKHFCIWVCEGLSQCHLGTVTCFLCKSSKKSSSEQVAFYCIWFRMWKMRDVACWFNLGTACPSHSEWYYSMRLGFYLWSSLTW